MDERTAVVVGGVLRHELCDLPTLPSCARGRAALLGDAARAMSPALGQGACRALEDAVTLADRLDGGPVDEALRRYDRLRRPRTRQVVRRSARVEAVARWAWPPAVVLRDSVVRLTPSALASRSMDPVLGWTP
ncbi:2-polyprenyl-6-methoxyphenol hydroxylase-like FAD-dependent oxidoreductase [Saccharothrix coeruleofusca]|uniref:FAD-dependent monooxygenase n=1 Tax=Saccharothrix coeruleofusca TaxID=33919 RepID=UPI001AE50697|nr:FAD-dependent monooxygenase [Saccharothrix coeruleofusca]MBP2336549.1 2-polyprenyl-6-methoxyphenol hydroxylase-like FAD-dependent oxidoreductase [Saccharothrix coeruleofusca]